MRAYDWSRPAPRAAAGAASAAVEEAFGLSPDLFARVPVLSGISLPDIGITCVTGFSGSGKSKLLELFLADHPEACVPADPDDERPLVELFGGPVEHALELMGQAGLGEAFAYLTPYRHLSDGQRARARLALACASGRRLLVVDEFLSTLDRTSAAVVAYNFQRFCRRHGISALVATAHSDVLSYLGPDLHIRLDFDGVQEYSGALVPRKPFQDRVRLRRGSLDDYAELARFHYIAELDIRPEAFEIEVHVAEIDGRVAAVALLSPPYPRSWERFAEFRAVNDGLTLSRRVVVHPVYRGIGISRLVCDPALAARPRVFLRSAQARFQPFPLALGYREVPVASNRRSDLLTAVERLAEPSADGGGDREDVVRLLRDRCVELMLDEYLQYRELAELEPVGEAARTRVAAWFGCCVEQMPVEALREAAQPFAMAGFVGYGPEVAA